MSDLRLSILIDAQNAAGSVLRGLGSDMGGLQSVMIGAGLAIAGALVGIGVSAVKMAADYQQAMTQLQNTTGSTDAQMKQYKDAIRSISDETGVAQTDLAKGMYQVVSANFAGADATRILTTATKAAVIAGADQTQVTTGLIVTLNAFGLKASQVDIISNQMFKTLSLGRGQMGDLAGALQTGGALVAHYGVSVTDMDATLATLSTGGMKTFGTSMTGLTQLLNVMDGKTDLISKRIDALGGSYKTASSTIKEHVAVLELVHGKMELVHKTITTHVHGGVVNLGVAFDEAKFKAMSFTQQVAYLNEVFKGHEQQMVAVLGSKQAATALGILGTQSHLLAENLKKLGDAQQLAKEKASAWARTQQDFNFQLQDAKVKAQNLMIDLGIRLLPIVTAAMGLLHEGVLAVSSGFTNLVSIGSQIVGFFQKNQWAVDLLVAALGGIAIAIGVAVIPGMIAAGITAIASFGAWAIAAGAAALATLAAAAPFIVIGVIAGAVIFGIIMAIQHWAQIISWLGNVWKTVFSAVGSFFSGVGGVIHSIISSIGGAFSGLGSLVHGVWDGITGAIKGAINDVIGFINGFIGFIDAIQIHIPSIGIGPIHTPSLDWNGLGIPKIPLLASGGYVESGGLAIIHPGEVIPAARVAPLGSGGGGGGHTFNITINAMTRPQSANELADEFIDAVSRRLRQKGNFVSWTSGGRQ